MKKSRKFLLLGVLVGLSAAHLEFALLSQPADTVKLGGLPALRDSAPSPRDLPADCAIVASEAASRLAATGAWTKIVHLTILTPHGKGGHSVCVWQPPTCAHVFVYDEYLIGGAIDTGTESHDVDKIVSALARLTSVVVLEAHFL